MRGLSLSELLDRLRQSLWVLPAGAVVLAVGAALGMLAIDAGTPDLGAQVPLLFGGGPEGARSTLTAIATSTITVAGVTFSITIVALQLSSTQFSPRVLRNFTRDRGNQLVLATFLGTFTYSLVVLRGIRGSGAEEGAFVPHLAVAGAVVLVFASLGMLIYFIDRIALKIQVSEIAAGVAGEAVRMVERQRREVSPQTDAQPAPPLPDGESGRSDARRSGYLQDVRIHAALRLASRHDAVVRLELPAGSWVQGGGPLYSVWPASAVNDKFASDLDRLVSIGKQRSMLQDPSFGIQQLVDIGVKAISPGINDPTTAMTCIDRLTEVLVAIGRGPTPSGYHFDGAGRLRFVVPTHDYESLVNLAFDQLRHFSSGMPSVSRHLARALGTIRAALPPDRHPPLVAQARLVAEAADRIEVAADRRVVLEACERLYG